MNVRPITSEEEKDWCASMKARHPLGNPQLAGHQIKYVAEKKGKPVALISFSACAYRLADRDRWIGWTAEQATRRRHFVVQNSRFLILPHEGDHRHNLASKTLAWCARRLSDDWMERFGYPVLLLETFVDPAYHRGTCYKASGWDVVGRTKGFRRDSGEFYSQDSTPKDIWLRSLRPNARDLLRSSELPGELAEFEKALPAKRVAARLGVDGLSSLFRVLEELPDSRRAQGRRYSMGCCLSILTCAILAGCKGLRECAEFAGTLPQKQLQALRAWRDPKTNRWRSPNYVTLWRVATAVDTELFEETLNKWFRGEGLTPEAIALDGKTLRGTLLNEDGGSCVVSAVSHDGSPFFSDKRSLSRKVKK
ncbi:MAG: DUF4338 domain-containing protein [Kiritimatiellaeota bacterium]|nr:DUF4338 domain-containing protein [Kiritimatiellota bacterium]